MVKLKLWACQELLKRYAFGRKIDVPAEDVTEMFEVIKSVDAEWYRKKAARIVLDYHFGKTKVDEMIREYAVVTDRSDRLVRKWRKAVLERDKVCMECAESENLHAHHISHWCDDPVNRINVDNGITLCADCHSKQHPEIRGLILNSRGGLTIYETERKATTFC